MTEPIHKSLAGGRWHRMPIAEQLANVGSEFERAAAAYARKDQQRFDSALARFLELLDLTISDPRWHSYRIKELRMLREEVCDTFSGGNAYGTSIETLKNYFLYFALIARANS